MNAEVKEMNEKSIALVANAVNPVENWTDPGKFDHMVRVAAALARSSIVPQSYQGKPEDCLIAFDMASRIKTNPLMVMQNLYVVKGKPSWSGQACATLISNSGRFSNVHHVRTGEIGDDSRGCYYEAIDRATGAELRGVEVTVAMAKTEGWWATNPKWRNLTELMLMYRAASFFAKEYCPDILMGVSADDEIYDIPTAPARGARKADDIAAEIDG